MSVVKIEITEQHISLLTRLEGEMLIDIISDVNEHKEPNEYHIEMCGVVLFGKPEKFNPMEENPYSLNDENMALVNKLISELPNALDAILYLKTFETGKYKTNFGYRNWKKIN